MPVNTSRIQIFTNSLKGVFGWFYSRTIDVFFGGRAYETYNATKIVQCSNLVNPSIDCCEDSELVTPLRPTPILKRTAMPIYRIAIQKDAECQVNFSTKASANVYCQAKPYYRSVKVGTRPIQRKEIATSPMKGSQNDLDSTLQSSEMSSDDVHGDSSYAPSEYASNYSDESSIVAFRKTNDMETLRSLLIGLMKQHPKVYVGLTNSTLCILYRLEKFCKKPKVNLMIVLYNKN
ncbi:uncharacterized protein [Bemisia tabaci]|uniref:uncharacterized protein n=1 Tax=Bemisia tabaci TaxID=7038 RepID=UPI003B2831F7